MRKNTNHLERARNYFISFLVYGLLIGVFIIVTLEFLGKSNITTAQPPLPLSEFSQLIGAGGSLVLSLALVVLYQRQTENQETLQAVEHTPNLQVDRFRQLPDEESTDSYEFEISNVGKAAATDLHLIIEPDLDDEIQQPIKPTIHRLKRTYIEESEWKTTNDSYINSGETNVRFFSSAGMNVEGLTHVAAFSQATEVFDRQVDEELQLRLLLRHSSPIEGSEVQEIVELAAPIHGSTHLDEFLEQIDRHNYILE